MNTKQRKKEQLSTAFCFKLKNVWLHIIWQGEKEHQFVIIEDKYKTHRNCSTYSKRGRIQKEEEKLGAFNQKDIFRPKTILLTFWNGIQWEKRLRQVIQLAIGSTRPLRSELWLLKWFCFTPFLHRLTSSLFCIVLMYQCC